MSTEILGFVEPMSIIFCFFQSFPSSRKKNTKFLERLSAFSKLNKLNNRDGWQKPEVYILCVTLSLISLLSLLKLLIAMFRMTSPVVINNCQPVVYVIYQTRETVFHRDIQTPRRELKIRRAAEYFWRNSRRLHWMADETLSRVFDISSQLKQKLRN